MHGKSHSHSPIFGMSWSPASTAVTALLTILILTLTAQAQTYSVIHTFISGGDGANPYAGVTVGPGGVLYGTASEAGTHGSGTVFKLSQVNSTWVFSPLYEFAGGSDGSYPIGGVVIGPNGALYGTTEGGGPQNFGIVFELRPPLTVCKAILCYWNVTVLHTFTGTPDGFFPELENLAFDPAGDIYGTTVNGGMYGDGITFELTPSGGVYTESIIHNFGSGEDGLFPYSGVVLDTAGSVYGITGEGGTGAVGTVYQLMPSHGGWVENVLVNFDGGNGSGPIGNLVTDASGKLYGTTRNGGQGNDGVVFRLAPSDGGFTYSVLYTFSSMCSPYGGVVMGATGNFFGVCYDGGAYDDGWVFELTNCGQGCTVVDLHDFSGSDGMNPYGSPALDANGNLYGTTVGGTVAGNCAEGCGVVWEITP